MFFVLPFRPVQTPTISNASIAAGNYFFEWCVCGGYAVYGVVYVASETIKPIRLNQVWDRSAWELANMYLLRVGGSQTRVREWGRRHQWPLSR